MDFSKCGKAAEQLDPKCKECLCDIAGQALCTEIQNITSGFYEMYNMFETFSGMLDNNNATNSSNSTNSKNSTNSTNSTKGNGLIY